MEMEITIRAEESELPKVNEMLSAYREGPEVKDGEYPKEALDLSDERLFVLRALNETPRSALRVIHQKATELEESPFDDYDSWNDERETVRDHLWGLKSMGLADNDGQRWYPTGGGELND